MSQETAPEPTLTPAGRDELLREIQTLRAAGEESRAARLEDLLRDAAIVAPGPAGLATVGSIVIVEDEAGARHAYALTGVHHASGRGIVSVSSPVGRALLGQAPGATIRVDLPSGGVAALRVVAIEEQRAA
jgi:transcription elongation GreA/GreB family factor